ncbi:RND family transporter [Halobacteriaceae archaeon GCM10025711]
MVDHEQLIERVDEWITERPLQVIAVFFVVTLVFGAGLGNVSSEAGTNQFTESSPAQEALDDVNREFSPAFSPGEGSTQLIQTGQNVLTRTELVRMLRAQNRLQERESLRVSATSSPAQLVARQLDPTATRLDDQILAVERATPSEIDRAVRALADDPRFTGSLSNDFNAQSASATASIAVVKHSIPRGLSASQAGASGESPLTAIQVESKHVVNSVGGDIRVFGSGVISSEFSNVIFDSLIIVIPAAVLLILGFLVLAYRDPIDLVLGMVSLVMAIVWTLGAMGLAGIPFTQMLTAVPPLLLAVGIDFGIHAINRYREERVKDHGIRESMRITTDQLTVAFFIVTGTTVIGFMANLTSDLPPIRDFGLVAGIGIVFTFLIFGIFLPAAKVFTDTVRDRYNVPGFSSTPLGQEGSVIGSILPVGVGIARRAPYVFLLVVLVVSVGAGYYGTGVDTSFATEDFLPPEESPDYLKTLPEPFAPSEYTVTRDLNYLEDNFESAQRDTVTVYVEGRLREDYALESIYHANDDPPDSFVTRNGRADATSIIGVIDEYAAQDPEFRQLVERNDVNDNGVPDDNLDEVYAELLSSPYRDRTLSYLSEDRHSTRVVYAVKSESSQSEITSDAKHVADQYRLHGIATGSIVVFQAVSDAILQSAVKSLLIALALTGVFLVLVYHTLEGRASLGVVNLVPIVVTVTLIAGTMRLFGVPFNALTATILAIAIGLGIDYSAHIVHRFADEYERGDDVFAALDRTVRGTGGALAGSMLTTTTGIGVLVLAITPVLGQFGFVTAMSIFYSFLTALLVTPSAVVAWKEVVE